MLKYKKIGTGQILRCWESKIRQIYGDLTDDKLYCPNCENLMGQVRTDREENYVKMEQSQFTYSGHKI